MSTVTIDRIVLADVPLGARDDATLRDMVAAAVQQQLAGQALPPAAEPRHVAGEIAAAVAGAVRKAG